MKNGSKDGSRCRLVRSTLLRRYVIKGGIFARICCADAIIHVAHNDTRSAKSRTQLKSLSTNWARRSSRPLRIWVFQTNRDYAFTALLYNAVISTFIAVIPTFKKRWIYDVSEISPSIERYEQLFDLNFSSFT